MVHSACGRGSSGGGSPGLRRRTPGPSGEVAGALEEGAGLVVMTVIQEGLGGIECDLRAGVGRGDEVVVDAGGLVGAAGAREDLGTPGVEGSPARLGSQGTCLVQPVEALLRDCSRCMA